MQINFLGTKVNAIFYNDLHGSTVNVDAFLKEQANYYKQKQNETNLTLSGGDIFVCTCANNETIAKKLCTQTDATCLGNHDIEGGEHIVDLIKKYALKGKMLAANLFFQKETEMEKDETFYTRSMDLSEEDFDLDSEFNKKTPTFMKVLIIIILLVAIAISVYFLKQYL